MLALAFASKDLSVVFALMCPFDVRVPIATTPVTGIFCFRETKVLFVCFGKTHVCN